MSSKFIVLAGEDCVACREAEASLKQSTSSTIVINAARRSSEPYSYKDSVEGQLAPYANESLNVMLQFTYKENDASRYNPFEWWKIIAAKIRSSSPSVSQRASVKANFNQKFGGGYITFVWDRISYRELVAYCRMLEIIVGPLTPEEVEKERQQEEAAIAEAARLAARLALEANRAKEKQRAEKARKREARLAEEARRAEEAKPRLAEEARRKEKRRAEEARKREIQSKRAASRVCVMCGKPLGFFQKLCGDKQHKECKAFSE